MRHYKKSGMKLGTDASHTKAIKRSLACALLANDRIKTTLQRAKAIRSDVDRVVTLAKRGDLASRRLAIARLGDASLVGEIFSKAAQGMWADRNGGYTRILKLGYRKGDNAEVVIIEMVTEPVSAKKSEAKPAAKSSKKTTAKKLSSKKSASKLEAKVESKSDEAESAEESKAEEKPAESKDETSETSAADSKPEEKPVDEPAKEDGSKSN